MTNFVEVIKACEAAEGSGSKKQIQAELLKADSTARELICLALDPYTVFGVKKFEMPTVGPRGTMGQVNYEEFFSILDKLANREITGDAARAAVTAAISLFPFSAQEYIARIFDKDLKAGFSAETANKVWNAPGGTGPQIPTFEVMLADKCEDTEDFEKYIKFPCQADWKYDGCLSASWKISLKDGRTVTIGEFVENDLEGEVLSFNTSTKNKEWKKVVAKIKNSMPARTYEWFSITLEDGTVLPPLTGNHRVWLPELKSWRRVDELDGTESLLKE